MLLNVIVQMPLSREALHAPDYVAVVGFLAGMYPHVSFQVAFFVEGPAARGLRTDIVLAPHVGLDVHFQALGPAIGATATLEGASVSLLLEVRLQVILQVTLGHEGLRTTLLSAGERPL